jgi:hypothetical protein
MKPTKPVQVAAQISPTCSATCLPKNRLGNLTFSCSIYRRARSSNFKYFNTL